jgi:hypothetical protein
MRANVSRYDFRRVQPRPLPDTFIVSPFLVPAFTLWLWKGEPPTKPADDGRDAWRKAA